MRREANKALDGTPEDRRHFLDVGHQKAQFEDDRVRVFRILGDPASGPGVKREATKALDAGTHAALVEFLKVGHQKAQFEDEPGPGLPDHAPRRSAGEGGSRRRP
ncbi:ALF repeat-containing protein [Streptomyces clavuligerus]|uniref:ALF repeat-containing protein n=1 Tax=Streptomyces clavuligerus TaxID=1901 RepID=UPI001F0850C9|nr:ALF repeat-containing protein [Streptomyces clavuligerus]